MHFADDPPHHLNRTGRARHDPGAQGRQIEIVTLRLIEHGDEHGRHAVQRSGFLFGDGVQGQQRIEGVTGVNHGAAVGDTTQIAHHHAEAVVQRHRNDQAIGGAQAKAFTDHVTVVENIVVTEGRAFGKPGGSGGVLDVHRLVEMQAVLALVQLLDRHPGRQIAQLRPGQETDGWLRIKADDAAQRRQAITLQLANGLLRQFRHQALQHGVVIGGLERPGTDQPLAAGLLQHVFQFGTAVGGVDVDQDHADFRTGDLTDAPLSAIRSPDPQAVPGLQAQRQHGSGVQVRRVRQLPPGVAQLLMAHDQRFTVRVLRGGVVERLADGHRQQGFVLGTAGVAALRMCTGLIHDDPYYLYCWCAACVARELAPSPQSATPVCKNSSTLAQVDVNVKGD